MARFYRPRPLRRGASAAVLLLVAAAAALGAEEAGPPAPRWEGAVGLIASARPEYSGAAQRIAKLTPALFLRHGRLSITNASGFVTRRADDVARGVAVELVQGERWRVRASLRYDRGRAEGSSDALAGMGSIRTTVRLRLAADYRLGGPWRLGFSWSPDLLGRGGGHLGDLALGWERPLAPRTTLNLTAALTLAGDRYLQTYYGVNEAQSARTAYPVYTPRAGLRDIALGANLRHDLDEDWVVIGGLGLTRLLDAAAASPLTGRRTGWGVSAGVARRF